MQLPQFIPNNQLRLLACGAEFFPALLLAICEAEQEILLETYIFGLDRTGQAIKQALIHAAQRGVQVKLITDWHGTGHNQIEELNLDLLPAGVQHRNFNPWFRRGVARSHRKLCVIDKKVAFVGGININDDLLCDFDNSIHLPAPRWDFAVQVHGPLVNLIWLDVSAQWQRVGALDWRKFIELHRPLPIPKGGKPLPMLASLVLRDNFRNRRTIQKAYLQAMSRAQKSVLLATPYFAPGRRFINALAYTAQRGIPVTLLIGVGQFHLQDAIAHSFYPKLLQAGVKIVEYRKTQLHAKVALVDDDWATVGSSNCDGLSLFLNQEANVVVKDAVFAAQLRQQFMAAAAEGVVIHPNEFARLAWYKHSWYDLTYWVYKNLMRIATWGHYG